MIVFGFFRATSFYVISKNKGQVQKMDHTVVNFEILANNAEKLRKFYDQK